LGNGLVEEKLHQPSLLFVFVFVSERFSNRNELPAGLGVWAEVSLGSDFSLSPCQERKKSQETPDVRVTIL
jgi:hypothetical protein